MSSKVIAGCFALCAFAVAIIAGLANGNPAAQILLRAAIAMFVCYPIGLLVGLVCERLIATHVGSPEQLATADPPGDAPATPSDEE